MTNASTLSFEGAITERPVVDVEIVVPVYNEAEGLESSIRRLHAFLLKQFPLTWTVTVADNASTDQTWGVACRLAGELAGVRAVHLDQKGRGLALRAVWSTSPARVVAYMDVDLSTQLEALLPLVAPLLSGHSDLAIGSRLATGARIIRGPKREFISRAYNLILRATLRNGFTDAQCGFKAVRADVAQALLPLIEDNGWFFDTELLVLAEHNGLRIHEVPVDWIDDPDTRVSIVHTAVEDLKGIWRMLRRFMRGDATLPADALTSQREQVAAAGAGQLIRFGAVGLVSTALFAFIFVGLRDPLGPIGAAVTTLAITAVLNLAANRRLTFEMQGPRGRRWQYTTGMAVAAIPVVATVAALLVLGAAGVTTTGAELVTLLLVNISVTAARYGLLKKWVFK
jgi:putative flippase GtrA